MYVGADGELVRRSAEGGADDASFHNQSRAQQLEASFRSKEQAGASFRKKQQLEASFATPKRRRHALERACEGLPEELLALMAEVRERVAQDRLPLLSLLQPDPLQMQSSHLSFQEYYAARALRSGRVLLPPSAAIRRPVRPSSTRAPCPSLLSTLNRWDSLTTPVRNQVARSSKGC